MSCLEELNHNQCDGIDPQNMNVYLSLMLDQDNPSILELDSSWGSTCVDLSPAVNAGETITHLFLTDSALQYNREDYGKEGAENAGVDCIEGDALSRIISMQFLKDVSQTQPIQNGYVYMYNNGLFSPFDLQTFVDQTNQAIASLNSAVNNLKSQVSALQSQVNSLDNRITNNSNAIQQILAVIAKPQGIPSNTRLVWGNVDLYSDYTNTDNRSWGLYTHSTSNDINNDLMFS